MTLQSIILDQVAANRTVWFEPDELSAGVRLWMREQRGLRHLAFDCFLPRVLFLTDTIDVFSEAVRQLGLRLDECVYDNSTPDMEIANGPA